MSEFSSVLHSLAMTQN